MYDSNDIFQWGKVISKEEIQIPRINEYIRSLDIFPFARLIEIQKKEAEEALILDFQVELPQNPRISINRNEIIAIVLSPQEEEIPKFLALRKSFPDTLHQNLVQKGEPKSLCLFEEPYAEIRLRTTGIKFLDRVANWLSRAAIEELHLPDQPLEPLLLTDMRIIFDPDLYNVEGTPNSLIVRRLSDNPLILKAFGEAQQKNENQNNKEISYLLIPIVVPPWPSRIIDYSPVNLEELCELLTNLNFNLQEHLRNLIEQFQTNKNWSLTLKKECILLLRLPKTRKIDGPIEILEYWAFIIRSTIEELSIKLGIRGKIDGKLGVLLGSHLAINLDSIPVIPLKPTYSLTKNFAKILSNSQVEVNDIVAIGLGALGSQVVLNLARQGFGLWHLVDNDVLLPHNFSRHGLSSYFEGLNKSHAVAIEMNNFLNNDNIAKWYPCDILNLFKKCQETENLQNIISTSELILDFSTSRAVTSFLATIESKAQRISSYINSKGTHLVVISEGKLRRVELDDLDKQMFARLIDNPELARFNNGNDSLTAYAGSCRDISVNIPQDTIGLFAGIASKYIKENFQSDEPHIMIWEVNNQTLEIKTFQLPVSLVEEYKIQDWSVHIPIDLIKSIQENRTIRLPNETGGILIGNFNPQNKVVYIVNFLPSPSDSVEWPTSYIRGAYNLKEDIEKIMNLTGNELCYVGEWHSHPRGYSGSPSKDDLSAHSYLVEEMGYEGLPGIMLIFSDDKEPLILLDEK